MESDFKPSEGCPGKINPGAQICHDCCHGRGTIYCFIDPEKSLMDEREGGESDEGSRI